MDFTRFEKLYDALPYAVTHHHPEGSLVSMQAYAKIPRITGPNKQAVREATIKVMERMKVPVTPENLALFGVKDGPITDTHLRGAVWDLQSGNIVWAPADTIAMAWLRDGNEIAMLRERYDYQPGLHKVIGARLQSEFTYTWERRSWPMQELISSCPIIMPTGWPMTLAISPRSDLAVFQWLDQGEGGVEFIAISNQGDCQLMQTGLPILDSVTDLCLRSGGNGFPIGSNYIAPPTFSPDGRYIVFTWQDSWEWWIDETNMHGSNLTNVTDDSPFKKDVYQVGFVEVIDWELRRVLEIVITTTLPHSWSPPDLDDRIAVSLTINPPTFIDNEHFTLILPTKEVRTYSVHEKESTTRVVKDSSEAIAIRKKARMEEWRKKMEKRRKQ